MREFDENCHEFRQFKCLDADDQDDEFVDLVKFLIGNLRWCVETRYVTEARAAPVITPIPGAGFHLSGIADVRGQILPIFDLALMLGLKPGPKSGTRGILVLGDRSAEYGIEIEGPPAFDRVSTETVSPGVPEAFPKHDWMIGSLSDGAIMLDGRTLLNDRSFSLG